MPVPNFPTGTPMRLDATQFQSMMLSHPGRQYFRWWRAMRTLPSDLRNGSLAAGDGLFTFEEVEWSAQRPMAVFDSSMFNRTFRPEFGRVDEGSISVVYAPDDADIGQDDLIMPWGCVGDGSDASSRSILEVVERGRRRTTGVGTVTVNGDYSEATFSHAQTATARYGDILVVGGGKLILGAFSDTVTAEVLGVIVAPQFAPANAIFEIGRDVLCHVTQVSSLDRIMASGQPSVLSQGRCRWDAETESVLWEDISSLGESPSYSVRYRAVPRYSIKSAEMRIPGLDYAPLPGARVGRLLHQAVGSLMPAEDGRR